jgi:hypothetical protein
MVIRKSKTTIYELDQDTLQDIIMTYIEESEGLDTTCLSFDWKIQEGGNEEVSLILKEQSDG